MNDPKRYISPGKPVKKRVVHEDEVVRITHLFDGQGNIVAQLYTDLTVEKKGGE